MFVPILSFEVFGNFFYGWSKGEQFGVVAF